MQLGKFAWRHKQLACLAAAICLYACSSDDGGMPRQGVVSPPGTGGATPIGSGGTNPLGNAGTSGKGTPAITGSGGKGMAGMAGLGPIGSGGKGGSGGSVGSGGTGSGGSAGPGPVMTAKDPVLPEITGECPEFRSGTIDVGGLSGIDMQVGPKGNGGGSIVFYWHGTGSSSFEAAQFGGTSEVLAAGGIIVAPSGSSGEGGDCSGTGTFSIGDMDAADQIAACAVRDYAIDPHRIYTTGCSAGGLQAACFAVLRSNYVAAAAPNSGGLTFPQAFQNPSHAPALMTMHGGDADMVIIYFRDSSKTADDAFKNAGGFVINCDHGGSHCGAPGDLQAAAWTFMNDHPFGVSPEPYTSIPAGFPDYCKIY
jgi:predicted esterase